MAHADMVADGATRYIARLTSLPLAGRARATADRILETIQNAIRLGPALEIADLTFSVDDLADLSVDEKTALHNPYLPGYGEPSASLVFVGTEHAFDFGAPRTHERVPRRCRPIDRPLLRALRRRVTYPSHQQITAAQIPQRVREIPSTLGQRHLSRSDVSCHSQSQKRSRRDAKRLDQVAARRLGRAPWGSLISLSSVKNSPGDLLKDLRLHNAAWSQKWWVFPARRGNHNHNLRPEELATIMDPKLRRTILLLERIPSLQPNTPPIAAFHSKQDPNNNGHSLYIVFIDHEASCMRLRTLHSVELLVPLDAVRMIGKILPMADFMYHSMAE